MQTIENKAVSPESIRNGLAQCIGSEEYYKHSSGLIFTSGIHFLAESAGAYWLIDAIGSWQPRIRRALGEEARFQVWELSLLPENSTHMANLVCRGDSDQEPVVRQLIHFTDFPLAEGIKIYVVNGTVLLPSEY